MRGLIEFPVGVFKGFSESGLEFRAEIISPYHTEYHPLLGSFLLVEIDRENSLLGRITKFVPTGVMISSEGDDYLAKISRLDRDVPEDLKEAKLRYNVTVKLLGTLKLSGGSLRYSPCSRKLPHLGARVGVPTEEVLKFVCRLGVSDDSEAVEIGKYSIGDIVYNGEGGHPDLPVYFDISKLVSKRTFVFARAGYGKSVLNKMLVTKLYEKEQDVGMLIFDPEGEYAFPDQKGRPGLVNIPELAEKLVVFTDKHVPGEYQRFVAGKVRLNLKEFRPADIVNICVSEEKQNTVFASRVRGLTPSEWSELVDLLSKDGYAADFEDLGRIIKNRDNAVLQAVLNNIVPVVKTLHDDSSSMMNQIKYHLKKGHVVVVDISLKGPQTSHQISALILNEIFVNNVENFTVGASGEIIKVVSVLEEAQTVLSPSMSDTSPFVRWAKEGRKYDLGGIFVTQQPGSISHEILSQGDNFFVFHLLSESDLKALKKANAHYSDDILASVLNEPIKGNCYMWSAPDQPFVLPVKITNFEEYARERSKYREFPEKTPAEIYYEESGELEKKFDILVRGLIERDRRVKVYRNITLDGKELPGTVAIKLYGLIYPLKNEMPPELSARFSRRTGLVREESIEESLKRQGILRAEKMQKFYCIEEGKTSVYIILPVDALDLTNKKIHEEPLHLLSQEPEAGRWGASQ
jgi:hypothetical protein